MSTNLGAAQLSGGMANPETAVNTATGRLDAAVTEIATVDLTNSVTLTSAQYQSAFRFDITPAGVSKTLTLPAVKRMVLFRNTSTNAITVVMGTTTFVMPVNRTALLYTDGTANGLIEATPGDRPFDMGIYIPGKPGAAQNVLRFTAVRAFHLPINLTGSTANAAVGSSGTAVFSLEKNGSVIGSVTFTASATGVLSFTAAVDFAIGDIFSIVAPATVDSALQDIAINLLGTR